MNAQTLVDRYGRFIPISAMHGKVVDANRNFCLAQPTVNCAAVHARFTRLMQGHTFVTAEQFRQGVLALIERVLQDTQITNLLNGVYLPICFPTCEIGDYGQTLEGVFLEAASRAYTEAFPARTFKNWRKGELAGKVAVVDNARHDRLIEAISGGPAVGLWFPTALQGFSIPADRAMMAHLPEDILLCGGIEPALGFVGYPEVLGRDGRTPALDCAALQWQDPEHSLCFDPYDSCLEFGFRVLDVFGSCSGSVVILWQP